MLTRQFGWNFETWLLRMSNEQQNVEKVWGTKKVRKTGWREPKSPPAPGECPKALLLAMIDLGHSHALQTGVAQHWFNHGCPKARFLICHPSIRVISVQRSALRSFNIFPLYSFLHHFTCVSFSWAPSSSYKVLIYTAQSLGLWQVARCEGFHCQTGQELCCLRILV